MKNVLLAGSTGYLGGYIAKELHERGDCVRALVRDRARLVLKGIDIGDAVEAELTRPETLSGCCEQIDAVVSTVGITRQKDGFTYMDVDYQANMNLLHEALASGVKKFVYVSVLNGESLRHLKICEAKERFVDGLKESGMDYCIIRPNGFFSDMTAYYQMAKKGRAYVFGDGNARANPIHGGDLAALCVDAIDKPDREIRVGGPQTLTQNEIAETAFQVLGARPKIVRIPDWIRVLILALARTFTGPRTYGPIEFFLTVMAIDMMAPERGTYTLKRYFTDLKDG